MSQYRHPVLDKWHVVINLFYNLAKQWKCWYTTMNNLHLVLFTKLPQTWSNVVIPTLSTCCEFDVTVSMLYRRFHHSIHDLLWGNVAPTLQIWRQSVNFVRASCFWCHAFTLQQHCQYNIQKRLWAGPTIQRCNVGTEATLE